MKADSYGKEFLKKIARPLIAVVLLILLFKTGLIKIDQLKSSITNPSVMLLGFFMIGIQYFFFAARWKIIVDFYKVISYFKILKLNLISQFFNLFIPGGVGGDVVKALELSSSEKIPKQQTLASIVIDRVFGLYCMILFSTIFLLIEINAHESIKKYFLTSFAMLIVATLGLVFLEKIILTIKKISKKTQSVFILKIIDLLETIRLGFKSVSTFKSMVKIILLSFIAQIFAITFIYYGVVITGDVHTPSIVLFFPLACFAFMASSIPLTPGGIGFGQAAFYFIFSIFSTQVAESVVIGVSLMQLFNILFSLPGVYFFTKIPKHTKIVTK